MRTIAIVNQKGGCGKTTTAINLASVFARRGVRTLIVDMDPQGHCAAGLGVPESQLEFSISEALLSDLTGGLDHAALVWEVASNLHLAPSTMRLAALEAPGGGLHELPDRDRRLEKVLEHLGVVIECGPLGAGNVVKLVTNQLWFVAAAALGEGFATGMANGVELGTLWRAIKESVGDSFVARHDAPSIFAGHYDPSFPLDLCLKDLGLLGELEAAVGTDLPMSAAARATFERAAERYGRSAGEMHVARRIEDDADLPMRLTGDWIPHWEK